MKLNLSFNFSDQTQFKLFLKSNYNAKQTKHIKEHLFIMEQLTLPPLFWIPIYARPIWASSVFLTVKANYIYN